MNSFSQRASLQVRAMKNDFAELDKHNLYNSNLFSPILIVLPPKLLFLNERTIRSQLKSNFKQLQSCSVLHVTNMMVAVIFLILLHFFLRKTTLSLHLLPYIMHGRTKCCFFRSQSNMSLYKHFHLHIQQAMRLSVKIETDKPYESLFVMTDVIAFFMTFFDFQ